MQTIKKLMDKKKWVVVGIHFDESRFGYKIPLRLKKRGYEVVGVNPKFAGQELEGIPIYASLSDLPEKMEVIDVLVNPSLSEKMIAEAQKLGYDSIWFQPGSWDEQTKQSLANYEGDIVYDCIYKRLG